MRLLEHQLLLRQPSAKSASRPSRCHEVDYDIHDDMQIVEVELDPSEVVIAEADDELHGRRYQF